MNTFNTLAQMYAYSRSSNLTEAETTAIAGVMVVFWLFFIVVGIISYVVVAICMMQIFKKAKVPTWIAWVPFYNQWKMLEIGGQQGFWAVLSIVPIANIVSMVFMYIAMYHIGKKLGKGDAFIVLGIFLPYVWFIWLAADKSVWKDSASTAPSLHKA